VGNSVLLKNASIIDGSGSVPYLGHIQIIDDKIVSVSREEIKPEEENTETINLEGKFIMPGLIDAHSSEELKLLKL
jgi:imidazolonepropionase-like amidohydrolase